MRQKKRKPIFDLQFLKAYQRKHKSEQTPSRDLFGFHNLMLSAGHSYFSYRWLLTDHFEKNFQDFLKVIFWNSSRIFQRSYEIIGRRCYWVLRRKFYSRLAIFSVTWSVTCGWDTMKFTIFFRHGNWRRLRWFQRSPQAMPLIAIQQA